MATRKKTTKKKASKKKTTSSKKKATKKKATKKKASKKKTTSSKKKANFKVQITKIGDREIHKELVYTDTDVIAVVHQCLGRFDYDYNGYKCTVDFRKLKRALPKLQRLAYSHKALKKLIQPTIDYLEKSMKLQLEMFEINKQAGQVSYADLWLLFGEGTEVAFEDHHVWQGGVAKKNEYYEWTRAFALSVETIGADGDKFFLKEKSAYVREFDGLRDISSLPFIPVSEDRKKSLTEQGKQTVQYIQEANHLDYDGEMIWRSWFGTRRYRASGRCIIDVRTFKMVNPDYGTDRYRDDDENASSTISSTDYWRISPWVKGFSFTSKQWGEFCVERLKPIKFDDKAFDRLVMPEKDIAGERIDAKTMIKSLVEEGGTSFTDIISGKGGGCIFLLHGPPGTGKTLTAEAVAEILHRPLYSITVGELGTDTEMVEENLRRVLDVATIWNAVVLIDEADIFLEERTVRDVERNALVAIFLRLLEYYQGVLFLTTNRVEHFDKAFYSRISIGLNYEALGEGSRAQVWTNLLAAAGIDGLNASELSVHDINGRQIKNSIRIAMALASADNRPIESADINRVIKLTGQFNVDLTGDKGTSKVKITK